MHTNALYHWRALASLALARSLALDEYLITEDTDPFTSRRQRSGDGFRPHDVNVLLVR